MSRKNLDTLQHEINAAVHPTGGLPKVTAPALNFVLNSLATEVAAAGDAGAPLKIVDYKTILDDLAAQYAATGAVATYAFAVGDVVTQEGQGLYQCIQAFDLQCVGTGSFPNNYIPSTYVTYWRQVQRSGYELFMSKQEAGTLVARLSGGPSAVVVADPTVPNAAPGNSAIILGGWNNTVAANRGAIVGGQSLTLPEGADYSAMLGGTDYTAPAQPNTVFAPKLMLWERGATLALTDFAGNSHTLAINEAGTLLINGQAWVRSLTLLDPSYTQHALTVGEAGTLLFDGVPLVPPASATPAPAPAPTPLMSFTAQTNYFVAADPETRRVPLEVPYLYEQPANLPDPELRDGGLVVPRRGYYEIVTRVVLEPNQLSPTDSCGICGGPDFDWMYQGWTDGSPAPRNLTAYMSRHMLLEAGDVVYLFAQFTGTAAKVLGQLTLYLLHNA